MVTIPYLCQCMDAMSSTQQVGNTDIWTWALKTRWRFVNYTMEMSNQARRPFYLVQWVCIVTSWIFVREFLIRLQLQQRPGLKDITVYLDLMMGVHMVCLCLSVWFDVISPSQHFFSHDEALIGSCRYVYLFEPVLGGWQSVLLKATMQCPCLGSNKGPFDLKLHTLALSSFDLVCKTSLWMKNQRIACKLSVFVVRSMDI